MAHDQRHDPPEHADRERANLIGLRSRGFPFQPMDDRRPLIVDRADVVIDRLHLGPVRLEPGERGGPHAQFPGNGLIVLVAEQDLQTDDGVQDRIGGVASGRRGVQSPHCDPEPRMGQIFEVPQKIANRQHFRAGDARELVARPREVIEGLGIFSGGRREGFRLVGLSERSPASGKPKLLCVSRVDARHQAEGGEHTIQFFGRVLPRRRQAVGELEISVVLDTPAGDNEGVGRRRQHRIMTLGSVSLAGPAGALQVWRHLHHEEVWPKPQRSKVEAGQSDRRHERDVEIRFQQRSDGRERHMTRARQRGGNFTPSVQVRIDRRLELHLETVLGKLAGSLSECRQSSDRRNEGCHRREPVGWITSGRGRGCIVTRGIEQRGIGRGAAPPVPSVAQRGHAVGA